MAITANSKREAEDVRYPQLFTERQAAEMLGVSIKTIQYWRYAGKVPYIKVNGCVRFTQEDIDSIMNRRNA